MKKWLFMTWAMLMPAALAHPGHAYSRNPMPLKQAEKMARYPGEAVAKVRSWLLAHPAFEAENHFQLTGPGLAFGLYRPLEKQRELVVTVHYEPHLQARSPIALYERVSVFHQRLGTETPCREALVQGAAEAGLLTAQGEPLNKVWSACTANTRVDFRQRDAAATLAALGTVFGPHDPLLADFVSATPVMSGQQLVSEEWSPAAYATEPLPLNVPIELHVYQGVQFDYLVSSNSITIVHRGEKNLLGNDWWSNWSQLAQDFAAQASMYQQLQPKQNQQAAR